MNMRFLKFPTRSKGHSSEGGILEVSVCHSGTNISMQLYCDCSKLICTELVEMGCYQNCGGNLGNPNTVFVSVLNWSFSQYFSPPLLTQEHLPHEDTVLSTPSYPSEATRANSTPRDGSALGPRVFREQRTDTHCTP